MAVVHRPHDPRGDIADAIRVADGRTTELLNDDAHGNYVSGQAGGARSAAIAALMM